MDFFKSVFSEDPEEEEEQPSSSNPENTPPSSPNSQNPNPNSSNLPAISTAWTFGSTLFKTLATKSESLVENYRRDLEDFSSGLKKETATIREAASRAVQDLPARLESGAAVAQNSLESVGQAIDNITDVIVTRGKDSISILTSDDYYSDGELSENDAIFNQRSDFYDKNVNVDSNKPYSRIESAIRAMQCDLKTYIEEPEDVDDYNEWRKGFVLEEKSEEIEDVVVGNKTVKEIYNEIVPGEVDHETFWSRYFYRLYRVKKVEEARMKLVERAISGEEEELSWDVDDDDDEGAGSSEGFKTRDELKKEIEENVKKMEDLRVGEEKDLKGESDEKESVSKIISDGGVEEKGRSDEAESSGDKLEMKLDDKAGSDGKNDNSDFSVISSQPSHEEEDLGWDEIEDIGSGDESKSNAARTIPNTTDLRKRLSAPEEEEDLSWDIDDDDEPVKS